MPVVNLHKAVQLIQISEDEDAPVFKLDLSDKSVNEKASLVAGCWAVYQNTLKAFEEGKIDADEFRIRQAAIYKQVIVVMLGEEAFNTLYNFLKGPSDLPFEEITMTAAPLAEYLLGEFDAIFTINRSKVMRDFIGESDGTDAI